jgi:hypothetical protein
MLSMTIGEGAKQQTAYMCRLNPPRVVQQVARGAVMASARGDQATQMSAVLTYEPTTPELVCFDGWRPRGAQPGKRLAALGAGDAAALFDALVREQGAQQAIANTLLGPAVGPAAGRTP